MNIISYFISGIAYLSKAAAISTGIYLAVIAVIGMTRGGKQLIENRFYIKHYFFCTYIVTVGFITGILQGNWEMNLGAFAFQAVPFKNMVFSQMFLDVLLFMPLGMMLPVLSRKLESGFKVTGISVLATLFIEVMQAVFKGRLADVNDIIANIVGTLAGYLLYKLFFRMTDVLMGFNTHTLKLLATRYRTRLSP